MEKKDFGYHLPQELIAQHPTEQREHSRLMVLDKVSGETVDSHFYNIGDFLRPGDCLVLNDTKVIPARIYGVREDTQAVVEFLLLKDVGDKKWECIAGPGKKAREGAKFSFGEGLLKAEIVEVKEDGNRIIQCEYEGSFYEILDKIGEMPLPHYIQEPQKDCDKDRYNTVYAKNEGSAAAPTAGLHFTHELLEKLEKQGVKVCYVTLHVGLGTFRPVTEEKIENHLMHTEHYIMSQGTADVINQTKKNGGRVVCVGTTSCRTVESVADKFGGEMRADESDTSIFIYPGYEFKCLDALITNFHLPESTLVMLVSALAGRENILNAYAQAVERKYRFFSFGDAMFIK